MIIFAHRANLVGPDHSSENSLTKTQECLTRGWSVETDIRRDEQGRFYISHDQGQWTPQNDAVEFCAAWGKTAAPIALNIKELGYEEALIEFLLANHVLDKVFLFDMELLEPVPGETARRFQRIYPAVHLAARVSEKNEPLSQALQMTCAQYIWLDEFSESWATEADVAELHRHRRQVFAVSPDLHGKTLAESLPRWRQFLAWGVDGICTDFPEALSRFASNT